MNAKILFVHGTGVREPGYTETLRVIRRSLAASCPDILVEPCFWGDACGSRLRADGASVPTYDTHRPIGDPDVANEEDTSLVLWSFLEEDPLFELRVAELCAVDGSPFAQDPAMLDKLRSSLGTEAEAVSLASRLDALNRRQDFLQAATWLADQHATRAALLGTTDAKALSETVARAVVARLIQATGPDPKLEPLATDTQERDELVKVIASYLAGSERGLMGSLFRTLTQPLQGLALRLGTRYAARKRGAITDAASPAAGDILLYQARGQALRDFIRQKIRQINGPVVLLAHSLGGIACVDLLLEQAEPQVKQLITAGSQAPFLYEIGALASLPFQLQKPADRLPAHFPPWLNFYDLRDFLSYVGGPLFGARVTDVQVNNRLSFPQSHSGYWHNAEVIDRVRKCLESL